MGPQLKRQMTVVIAVLIVFAGWYFSNHKNNPTPPSNQTQTGQDQNRQPTQKAAPETEAKSKAETQKTANTAATKGLPQGSGFDFYVMSLSWSPTWCAGSPDADSAQQCTRRLGLVMHGFWPQFERGYPADCPSREPDRIPDSLARSYLDLIPSIGLMGHEWRKHGTCSGLSQADYLATARAARNSITVPKELETDQAPASLPVAGIEQEFIKINPGLSLNAVSVTCKGQMLEEIRICLTKDLKFRDCGDAGRSSCRLNSVSLPSP